MEKIHSFREATKILGFRFPHTISDIASATGVTIHRLPHSGSGKGISASDLSKIKRNLDKLRSAFTPANT